MLTVSVTGAVKFEQKSAPSVELLRTSHTRVSLRSAYPSEEAFNIIYVRTVNN